MTSSQRSFTVLDFPNKLQLGIINAYHSIIFLNSCLSSRVETRRCYRYTSFHTSRKLRKMYQELNECTNIQFTLNLLQFDCVESCKLARIRSWNQPVLGNSMSLTGFSRTHAVRGPMRLVVLRLRVRRVNHSTTTTPPNIWTP